MTPMKALPHGPFRFVALDVETANHDRASICQVGLAFVRLDGSMRTWSTLIDPQVDRFAFTWLHGICARPVLGAPTIGAVIDHLDDVLTGQAVYQHSGFDRSAVRAACARMDRSEPIWDWHDSVQVARRAWPELRGRGGHGLASLKTHLGLVFVHHDADADTRAAAEVVLRAESVMPTPVEPAPARPEVMAEADACVIDDTDAGGRTPEERSEPAPERTRLLGHVALTQGNIDNHHIYLREVIHALPDACIGGSSRASTAPETVEIDCGIPSP